VIGVVDYEAGNIASVANALAAIGARFVVSGDAATLGACRGIILPGVGAAPGAMASLRRQGLPDFLAHAQIPVLGICLGMQLLYGASEEGATACLGVWPGTVKKFPAGVAKIPHMGWNVLARRAAHPLLAGIGDAEHFYFAHSYYADAGPSTVAASENGTPFAAVVADGLYAGVQFHPEKSGRAGLALLKNFDALCTSSRR
jgi:glutamine amidotransferase